MGNGNSSGIGGHSQDEVTGSRKYLTWPRPFQSYFPKYHNVEGKRYPHSDLPRGLCELPVEPGVEPIRASQSQIVPQRLTERGRVESTVESGTRGVNSCWRVGVGVVYNL